MDPARPPGGGSRAPGDGERFVVIEGRAAFEVGGERVEAGAGETVSVPPGTCHVAWNPTDDPVRLRLEFRPALAWAEFVERLFKGEDPVLLSSEFPREVGPC